MGSEVNLDAYFADWQTENIIIKPVISGGAKNTWKLTPTQVTAFTPQLNALLQEEAFLVQPFLPQVNTEGEWSLLYFNGQFSHCVLKVPPAGDFRVQHYYGGAIVPRTPPDFVQEYGSKLVKQFAPGCLYARVDGLVVAGTFRLTELELIEPMLYLQENEALYENYYQALRALAG